MEKSAQPHTGDRLPLPPGLATQLAGWSSRARQYRIFSPTWFGYRMRSFLAPLVLLALILALIAAFVPRSPLTPRLYISLLAMWLIVALAVSLGRALAVWVGCQRWTAPREAAGLGCALLFGIIVSLSLTPFTRVAQPPTPAHAAPARELVQASDDLINAAIWFPVLAWLGGAFDLAAYFRQRRMLREARLLEQAEQYKYERNQVEMRLSVLAGQVEPHFLFNTLSGVRAAMLSDPARGMAMIDHLVDYLRSSIPQLRADQECTVVALGSQLDSAKAYLGIIQARMPRLSTSIECSAELRSAAIPPLMLISLVENAVKHGIELKRGPAGICIKAERIAGGDAGMLELSVADDGMGFGGVTTGSGIGLSNIRERLQHLYGGDASLSLRASPQGGVVASIVLPLRAMTVGKD